MKKAPKLVAPHAPDVVALVTGGFHTSMLTDLFRQHHVSYLVITPSVDDMTDRDHDLYVKRLNGHMLSINEVLASAPATFGLLGGSQNPVTRLFHSRQEDTSLAVAAFLSQRSVQVAAVVALAASAAYAGGHTLDASHLSAQIQALTERYPGWSALSSVTNALRTLHEQILAAQAAAAGVLGTAMVAPTRAKIRGRTSSARDRVSRGNFSVRLKGAMHDAVVGADPEARLDRLKQWSRTRRGQQLFDDWVYNHSSAMTDADRADIAQSLVEDGLSTKEAREMAERIIFVDPLTRTDGQKIPWSWRGSWVGGLIVHTKAGVPYILLPRERFMAKTLDTQARAERYHEVYEFRLHRWHVPEWIAHAFAMSAMDRRFFPERKASTWFYATDYLKRMTRRLWREYREDQVLLWVKGDIGRRPSETKAFGRLMRPVAALKTFVLAPFSAVVLTVLAIVHPPSREKIMRDFNFYGLKGIPGLSMSLAIIPVLPVIMSLVMMQFMTMPVVWVGLWSVYTAGFFLTRRGMPFYSIFHGRTPIQGALHGPTSQVPSADDAPLSLVTFVAAMQSTTGEELAQGLRTGHIRTILGRVSKAAVKSAAGAYQALVYHQFTNIDTRPIIELLLNAIDTEERYHFRQGDPDHHKDVYWTVEDGRVIVRDQGEGIGLEDLPKLLYPGEGGNLGQAGTTGRFGAGFLAIFSYLQGSQGGEHRIVIP